VKQVFTFVAKLPGLFILRESPHGGGGGIGCGGIAGAAVCFPYQQQGIVGKPVGFGEGYPDRSGGHGPAGVIVISRSDIFGSAVFRILGRPEADTEVVEDAD